ncbi:MULTISPECIES: pro-sigmaK processing inhibitor BofA family protein [Caproicibacterium]|uniref:Pro-sigmaK processing inhibitor BofA family protein n=1 Tax=Caproicibacterium argilliputei TaxID=3030016 RepID=A0AA97DAC6_9FIRM|nr:pro-sigmaK processing inhibitor BofA family protein [Caproicibacterium argilliputei]WOC33236.1 pro-sigmaK processing inhibitor BofA family protein [Caproicibacterium argilliputei]
MRDILFAVILFGAFLFSAALLAAGKSPRPFVTAAGSVVTGLAALFAVSLTSSFTGVSLPISPISMGVSAFLGIPGVTVLLLLNLIFA